LKINLASIKFIKLPQFQQIAKFINHPEMPSVILPESIDKVIDAQLPIKKQFMG
jgi:hypothetical protein